MLAKSCFFQPQDGYKSQHLMCSVQTCGPSTVGVTGCFWRQQPTLVLGWGGN